MIKVSIVGSGNVAEAFAVALSQSCGVELCEVAGRNQARLAAIAEITGCRVVAIESLAEADIYILAVSDGAVAELVGAIPRSAESLVVHCAGSVAMVESGVDGVIYPMQSFTVGRRVNFRQVPLFIEARRGGDTIEAVAKALSNNVICLSSEQRRQLHLGAVFACNFTNAMLTACGEVVAASGIELEIYRPLVEETIAKAFAPESSPQQAQTGAARRGDIATQQRHHEMLEKQKRLKEIYQIISKYIWETSKRI